MLGALAALLPAGAAAQQSDARQRTTETIVADGLAQLPAADAKVFNQVMGELAATGSKGVEMIAAMLVPADKGKNATFEYALNGVVAYVTDPAHEALRDDVRKGLLAAIDRCGDDANRAFLFSQLQFCSTAADAAAMARYLDDPYLAGYALRALVSTPGTEALLLAEAGKDDLTAARKQALAYAFAEKRLAAAEPFRRPRSRSITHWPPAVRRPRSSRWPLPQPRPATHGMTPALRTLTCACSQGSPPQATPGP